MANVEIWDFGINKVKVISLVRQYLGCGLKEAKDFVDGNNGTIEGLSEDEANTLVRELSVLGASAKIVWDEIDEVEERDLFENQKRDINSESTQDDSNKEGKYKPIVNANAVSNLDRDQTMAVLLEVERIAKESEKYEIEMQRLLSEKYAEKKNAEVLLKQISKSTKMIIWAAVILATLFGLIIGGPLAIVTGLGMLIVMNLTVKRSYLRNHKEENQAAYDAYLQAHVAPIENRMNEIDVLRDGLNKSGKKPWAIDVVGREMFYSGCVSDLYNLVKGRRADSLKEALNKYDDAQHKMRMEQMQMAIQNASEITAEESAKQTVLQQQIELNTHQAATAAKATAHHTRQVERNTRRFR